MAFGGVLVDQIGPTRDFPAASMVTGLLGNALGWHWTERARHDALQERLVLAAAVLREGRVLTDVQNAELSKADKGWTTRGAPEGRDGGSYSGPHRRWRDYIADGAVLAVITFRHPEVAPTLDEVANALERPARPLFIGRKPCLPSRPILDGWVSADTAHTALREALGKGTGEGAGTWRALWPEGEGPDGDRLEDLADLRDWRGGLHAGARRVVHGRIG